MGDDPKSKKKKKPVVEVTDWGEEVSTTPSVVQEVADWGEAVSTTPEKKNSDGGNGLAVGLDGQLQPSVPTTSPLPSQNGNGQTPVADQPIQIPPFDPSTNPADITGAYKPKVYAKLPVNGQQEVQTAEVNDFGLSGIRELAKRQRASSDQTKSIQVQNTLKAEDVIMHGDEREVARRDKVSRAIDNTVKKLLPNVSPDSPKFKAERKKFEDKLALTDYNQAFPSVSVSTDENGEPGLKRNVGFFEGIATGWKTAMQSEEIADKFVNKMTDEERLQFLQQQPPPEEETHPEFIGKRNSGLGSLGEFGAGAAPLLGRMGAGIAIGTAAIAGAPESLGASLAGLPTALSFLLSTPSMVNQGAMGEVQRRFEILKKDHLEKSDLENMQEASKGRLAGGIGGILTNAAFTGAAGAARETFLPTIKNELISPVSRNVFKNAAMGTLHAGLNMAKVTTAVDIAQQIEGTAEGIKLTPEELLERSVDVATENLTTGMMLHAMTMGVTGLVQLPAVVKNAIKRSLVKDVKDPSEIQQTMDANEQSGIIPPGTTVKVINDINNYRTSLEKTSPDLDEESRAHIAGLIQKKTKLADEQSKIDPSQKQTIQSYQDQINEIDVQIGEVEKNGNPLQFEKDDLTGENLTTVGPDEISKPIELNPNISAPEVKPEPQKPETETDLEKSAASKFQKLKEQKQAAKKPVEAPPVVEVKPEGTISTEDAKFVQEAIDNNLAPAADKNMLITDGKFDEGKVPEYLKFVSEQAHTNEKSMVEGENPYDQSLIDLAKEKFPAKTEEKKSETVSDKLPTREEIIEKYKAKFPVLFQNITTKNGIDNVLQHIWNKNRFDKTQDVSDIGELLFPAKKSETVSDKLPIETRQSVINKLRELYKKRWGKYPEDDAATFDARSDVYAQSMAQESEKWFNGNDVEEGKMLGDLLLRDDLSKRSGTKSPFEQKMVEPESETVSDKLPIEEVKPSIKNDVTWENTIKVGNKIKFNGKEVTIGKVNHVGKARENGGYYDVLDMEGNKIFTETADQKDDSYVLYQNGKEEVKPSIEDKAGNKKTKPTEKVEVSDKPASENKIIDDADNVDSKNKGSKYTIIKGNVFDSNDIVSSYKYEGGNLIERKDANRKNVKPIARFTSSEEATKIIEAQNEISKLKISGKSNGWNDIHGIAIGDMNATEYIKKIDKNQPSLDLPKKEFIERTKEFFKNIPNAISDAALSEIHDNYWIKKLQKQAIDNFDIERAEGLLKPENKVEVSDKPAIEKSNKKVEAEYSHPILKTLSDLYDNAKSEFHRDRVAEDLAYSLAGDSQKEFRQKVMSALIGEKTPIAKSGVNAIAAEFKKWIKENKSEKAVDLQHEPIIADDKAENDRAVLQLTDKDNIEQEPGIKVIEGKAESSVKTTLNEVVVDANSLIAKATGVTNIPVSELATDEASFQNREGLNEKKVQQIVDNYNPSAFDPIQYWTDQDGQKFTLNHHRFEAAKRMGLSEIPARALTYGKEHPKTGEIVPPSDKAEAIRFAKEESNVNRSMETPLERAKILKEKRNRGDSDIPGFLEQEGRNKTFIENMSYLNPKGKAVDAIKQFNESPDKQTQKETEKIADWIGEARKRNPALTDAHENEMFAYLKDENNRITNKNDFVDKVNKASFGLQDGEPLNLKSVVDKSDNRIEWDQKKEELQKTVNDLKRIVTPDKKTGWTGLKKEYVSKLAQRFGGDAEKGLAEFKNPENQKIYAENLNKNRLLLKSALDKLGIHLAKENDLIQGDKSQQNLFNEQSETYTAKEDGTQQEIPYKSFATDDYPTSSGDLQQTKDQPSNLGSTVRGIWSKVKDLQFSGKTKVKSHADVAHIMRLLENKSVEHGFAVHVNKAGKVFIQFLSIGGRTGTVVDPRDVLAGAKKHKAVETYLVHNHPSGNLKPSNADISLTDKIRSGFKNLGIKVQHIIMDTFKGDYTLIDHYGDELQFGRNKSETAKTKIKSEKFDAQEALTKPLSEKIKGSQDVAATIHQFRFSALPKRAVLLLNQANEIIANHVIREYKDAAELAAETPTATNVIFYGNEYNLNAVKEAQLMLRNFDIKVLDYITSNSEGKDIIDAYESAADSGLLHETQEKYGTNSVDKEANLFEDASDMEEMKDVIRDIQKEFAERNTPLSLEKIKSLAKKGMAEQYDEAAVEDAYNAVVKEKKVENKKPPTGESPPVPPTGEGEGDVIGISHARLDEVAAEMGIPTYQKDPTTIAAWDAEADRRISNGEMQTLIKKLEVGTDIPTAPEQRMLLKYFSGLKAEYDLTKSDAVFHEFLKVKRLSDIVAGRLWGQSGRARQGEIPVHPLAGGILSAMAEKAEAAGVDVLTDKQKSEVESQVKEYEERTKTAEAKVTELEAKIAEIEAKKIIAKTKPVKTGRKTADDFKAERQRFKDDLIEAKKEHENWLKDQGIQKSGFGGFTLTPKMVKAIGKIVSSHVEELGNNLAEVTARVLDEIKDIFPGVQAKDVHDIIAGEYSDPRPTLSELRINLRDLRHEAKLINQIIAIENGVPKTEKQKVLKNQRIKNLRDQLQELKKETGYDDKTKLQALKTRNETLKKKIEDRINSGDFTKEKPTSIFDNKELQRKYPQLYAETLDAIKAKEDAKHDYDIAVLRDQQSQRGILEKGTDILSKVSGTVKAIVTGIDDSSVAIQTYMASLIRPGIGARALAIHAEHAFSQKRFDRWLTALHNSPDWKLIQDSGLSVTEPSSLKEIEKEEIFNNRFSGTIKIKGKEYKLIDAVLKPFERAFTSLGNSTRVIAFRQIAGKYMQEGNSFENNPELFKSLAQRLNTETGRGQENEYIKQASKIVTLGIWSPKLMSSKFNILGVSDVASLFLSKAGTKGYYRQLHPRERAMAIRDVAQFTVTVVALSYLASLSFGGQVDDDPLSPTFMDVTLKNGKSFNLTGGFSSYIRQIYEVMRGKRTDPQTRKTKDVSRLSLIGRFFRGKTPPITSAMLNAGEGKNFMGQKTTVLGEAKNVLLPISLKGISEQIKNDKSVGLMIAEGIPTFLGFNVKDKRDYKKQK